MSDQEISQLARETEKHIGDLLNDFLARTGVEIDPKVGVYDAEGFRREAIFILNAYRKF